MRERTRHVPEKQDAGPRKPAAGHALRGVSQARTEAEEMARSLLNATSDCALLIDPRGTILATNAAMAARYHLHEDELVGECIYDFFSYPRYLKRKAVIEEVLRSKSPVHFEDRDKDGRIYDARAHPVLGGDGNVTRVAIFARDVTEAKQAEEERTRLITAIEQAAEAFIICDDHFHIQYVNQAFEAMTGYSSKDVKGHGIAMLYDGERQIRSYEGIVDVVAQGDAWLGRTCNTRKDGSVFQSEKTVSPIRGKFGVILGYVSAWRDVTQLVRLERELRQAQKMEAIATLASGIAHDFNNILSPIIMQAEMGLGLHARQDPASKSFRQILAAAERAAALVDQIMGLGIRREVDEPIPFHLSSIVKECLKLLRPSLPSTIRIVRELEGSADVILADPTQIHQVIMNLCTNAAHAMRGQGGVLTLAVRDLALGEGPRAHFPDLPAGQYVVLTVKDTGHGIAPEHMGKLFDPFFTTKRTGVGTGLGLTMVQAIVAQLKGDIRVESEPGKGTAFHVAIPRSTSFAASRANEAQASGELWGTERVLIVDDEESILASGKEALEQLGYEVTVCAGPAQALELAAKAPGRFDLVLSDMTMPNMTGLDLARELFALAPGLPVVLSTGYSAAVTPEMTRASGVRGVLRKPYGLEALARAIRRALDAGKGSGRG